MYFVYAIKSDIKSYIYVGISNDYKRRLMQHNKGYNKTTKVHRPFTLILLEKYPDRKSARIRERKLKSGFGKEYLKTLA